MKSNLKLGIIILFGVAILYQVYIFFLTEKINRPSIPDISLILLNNTKTSVSQIGEGKQTVVFLVNSNCDYCKREIGQVRSNLDKLVDTEIVFVLFENLNKIKEFKESFLPEERAFITFAQAKRENVDPFLENELVYPYMLWYDENGMQKVQHRGLYPISKIIDL
ncbi:peroxiredoxin family protein [Marinigracilibium pacificum]|uniref:Redoxin domain-containing protein n=1 Tax=Marinigracilibium pacificum TaxID=2729599 RepID=A0A848J0U9_9BACT|nr:redoxin domain-containing protein [Marinigracilibium pacificum]NMM49291.1 redoxin domain-containing protein [Marinigracilibium pacificum]